MMLLLHRKGFENMSRFSEFTDDEVYMLKRQAIEGSWEIMMGNPYTEDCRAIHNCLLNELVEEDSHRQYKER